MTTDEPTAGVGVRTQRLGGVTLPSGVVLLLDAAATGVWSAGAPPPEADLVDLALTGEGAEEVARRFDHDFDPGRVHDVPREEADELAVWESS